MNRTADEHELTDDELVRRAQRGVPAAFAQLVSRYQDRVFNTCYRMCHNEADALDLTQSTFLKALEGIGKFQGRSKFYTWVFRIAVNLAISHRRTAARQTQISLDTVHKESPGSNGSAAGNDDVSRRAEQRELHERLEAALQQLDDEFRAAVVLKDIEDLDYASIAEILDVPVGTVKSRIHRARLLLRQMLSGERVNVDQP